MNNLILNSFEKLKQYCEENEFTGWDPYDGLNSKLFKAIPSFHNKRIARLAWIQFFKRSFINFRTLAVVKKGLNPKGIALFISAYCNLTKLDNYNKTGLGDKIEQLADLLITLNSRGYSGSCWGYNFDWEAKAFFLPKYTPSIVVTTYAANALLDAYEVTNKELYLEKAISTKRFILSDLNRTYHQNGNFAFSYSPLDKTSVFNASLLGARLLGRIYSCTNEEDLKANARKAVGFCAEQQNTNGSWYYSALPHHQWIDNFHTGFNLECIWDYYQYTGDKSFLTNFQKGTDYYLNTFFDPEGRSKYYNNAIYPIDAHAPSQLIVTLSKTKLFIQHRDLVERVLSWTIRNMQSKKGYFYYQRRRFYTNKIPYMRWSQAWMFYGMTHYLLNDAGDS